MKIKLHEYTCVEYLEILRTANQQWYGGYNYEASDYLQLKEAMRYFEAIQKALGIKLIKEGKL